MSESLASGSVSTRIERIAELARKHPERAFRSLHHAVDVEWLREAYRRTRKDAAAGVDGQTAKEYERDLGGNLEALVEGLRTGTYYAPPVRRVHIPKGDGRTRPIGIPTFEDKVLQRAVAMVLEAIYEQDFHPSSFGFRPGRGAHEALDELWKGLMPKGGWVLEVDIQDFFGSLDHSILRGFLDGRITDGVLRRAIDKWLKAGVLEDGAVTRPESGTPQGGVISPLLANIYLHEVLDVWFENDVKPRLKGRSFLVRYADDFVIGFEQEADAMRVKEVLAKRFAKYGLTLHPDKTRLVKFERPRRERDDDDHGGDPGSFDFLGFTHHWALSQKGNWIVKRRTMRTRLTRGLERIRAWCRDHRHLPIAEQCKALGQKMRGHYGYYGITGNHAALARFAHNVRCIWRFWLNRRSQRAAMAWERFSRLLTRYPLPQPRVVHSVFTQRAAKP
ncbi:MAG TPA: group II intron reverse transcriptase/maturase [Phycisphaerales bacterium]|nr:group II intron reverse transcriptase/maturase [Phycisphaerales bacterium]